MPHPIQYSEEEAKKRKRPRQYSEEEAKKHKHEIGVCTVASKPATKPFIEKLVKPDECKVCGPYQIKHDCGECPSCVDKPKFGGSGKRKRKCVNRECVVVAKYRLKKSRQRWTKRKDVQNLQREETIKSCLRRTNGYTCFSEENLMLLYQRRKRRHLFFNAEKRMLPDRRKKNMHVVKNAENNMLICPESARRQLIFTKKNTMQR